MSKLPDDVLVKVTLEQINVSAQHLLDGLLSEHYGRVDYRLLYSALGNLRALVDSARVAAYRQALEQGNRPVGAPPRKVRAAQFYLEV